MYIHHTAKQHKPLRVTIRDNNAEIMFPIHVPVEVMVHSSRRVSLRSGRGCKNLQQILGLTREILKQSQGCARIWDVRSGTLSS